MLKKVGQNPDKELILGRPWVDFWAGGGGKGEVDTGYTGNGSLDPTRFAPEGCGGCFWLQNQRLDAPGGPYLVILIDF